MRIQIDNRTGTPIYQQIYDQLKDQILRGELAGDTPLPSIRNLAKDLRISVITTKRAYEELERDGYLYTLPGKGSFVAPKNEALLREEHLRQIEDLLQQLGKLAAACQITREELEQMILLSWEEWQ